jgi:hypothetical protein
MRVSMVLLCTVVTLATLLTSCARPDGHMAAPTVTAPRTRGPVQQLSQPRPGAVAGPMDPDLRIGPIFVDGAAEHVCTGAVVHSGSGNLVLTAAHCLGGASKVAFVPGFAGNAQPTDVWVADAVYFDPRWIAGKDPRADYAIARVSSLAGGSVESRTGLALTLGTAPPAGTYVTVMGYPTGVGGSPIGCQAITWLNDSGYPSLECAGMVAGTSGAPWVNGTIVTGLIGGLEGGGCAENVSYSAPFDEHVGELLSRADAGGRGDTVPREVPDSC